MFGKGINITNRQWMTLCGIGSPCHTLLDFADTDLYWRCCMVLVCLATHCLSWLHREKCTKELLVVVFQQLLAAFMTSGQLAEPHGFFWIKLSLLIHEWCLWVDRAPAAAAAPYELNWQYPEGPQQQQGLPESRIALSMSSLWYQLTLLPLM